MTVMHRQHIAIIESYDDVALGILGVLVASILVQTLTLLPSKQDTTRRTYEAEDEYETIR